MTEALPGPRTLDYQILRVCERLHLSEANFFALDFSQQLRLLAYSQIRDYEDALWNAAG